MALTDNELFDFDKSRIEWSEEEARNALQEHPELYRNHLIIAKWIDGWVSRLPKATPSEAEYWRGFEQALREVAANLRQCDLLPGGVFHDETVGEAEG